MGRRLPRFAALLGALLALASGAPARAEDAPKHAEPGFLMFEPYPAILLKDTYLERLHRTGATGVLVIDVVPGGPADLAGVLEGDLLLRFDGEAVTVPADIDGNDASAGRESFEAAFAHLTDRVRAGAKVVLGVERGGKELTLEATAVGDDARERLQAAADEQTGVPKVPAPSSGGLASAASLSFEKDMREGTLRPDECLSLVGDWEVEDDDGATTPNHVLRQKRPLQTEGLLLVTGAGRAYGNGTFSVRARMDGGGDDASAGLVLRAKDHRSFYVARVAAKDGQFRLVVVKDGKPTTLASAAAPSAATGAWHAISVTLAGSSLKATLDGGSAVAATDATYASGWTGLWTKGAAESSFDDWKAVPSK